MAQILQRPAPDTIKVLDCPLPGRHVLVVGGGPVAARRVDELATSTHAVTVVATHLCDDMYDLLAERRITWENRAPRPSDLDDVWLVHTASGDAALDALVGAWVEAVRQARAVSAESRSS